MRIDLKRDDTRTATDANGQTFQYRKLVFGVHGGEMCVTLHIPPSYLNPRDSQRLRIRLDAMGHAVPYYEPLAVEPLPEETPGPRIGYIGPPEYADGFDGVGVPLRDPSNIWLFGYKNMRGLLNHLRGHYAPGLRYPKRPR